MDTMDILRLKVETLTKALETEREAHLQTQAKLPKIERGLNKANQFIYDMKIALANADSQYTGALDLFNSILKPVHAPRSAISIAELYNAGKSLSEMAAMVLGSKTKKSTMDRIVRKYKKSHPELFVKIKST